MPCSVKQSSIASKQHFNPLVQKFYTRICQIVNSSSNFENNQNTYIGLVVHWAWHQHRIAHGSTLQPSAWCWAVAGWEQIATALVAQLLRVLFCSGSLLAGLQWLLLLWLIFTTAAHTSYNNTNGYPGPGSADNSQCDTWRGPMSPILTSYNNCRASIII